MGKHKLGSDISDIFLSRKIGLIDFSNSQKMLISQLKSAGFKSYSIFDSKKSDLDSFLRSSDFFIVIAGFERKALPKINRAFIKNKKSYLLLQFDPVGGTLGPVLGLEGGPCYACWQQLDSAELNSNIQNTAINKALSEIIPGTLVSLMIVELVKLITLNQRPRTYDGFFELDLLNLETQFVKLGPSPHCPVCRAKR